MVCDTFTVCALFAIGQPGYDVITRQSRCPQSVTSFSLLVSLCWDHALGRHTIINNNPLTHSTPIQLCVLID